MTVEAEQPVLIVGTGAMACLFAARLSASGRQVWMLGSWKEGIRALQSRGVRLIDASGNEKAYPVRVKENPDDFRGARVAIVLVKSWQTERAARQLSLCLAEDGLALTLQNGLGNREILAKELGDKRVSLGVTTVGANLPEPGCVIQAGEGIVTICDGPGISKLVQPLREAGFLMEIKPAATALLWGKLVINAAINPLTAILRVQNGKLLEQPDALLLLRTAALEAAAVAAAQGICLPYDDPVTTVETVARRTASNRSSMLQDVLRGAPTEIDAICGAILQVGEQYKVPTPTIQTLFHLVKSLQPEAK